MVLNVGGVLVSAVFRCPGSIGQVTPTPEERKCPRCGRTIEIWSDEQKATCRCGFTIYKDKTPSCAEWCSAAERCLGGIIDIRAAKEAARASTDADDEARHKVRDVAAKLAGSRTARTGRQR